MLWHGAACHVHTWNGIIPSFPVRKQMVYDDDHFHLTCKGSIYLPQLRNETCVFVYWVMGMCNKMR
jgi:hypothetical protein